MSLFAYYYALPAPVAGLTYSQTLLALTPTAYWRLGESSGNAADSSGNSRTLTAGGTPTYSAAGWPSDGDTAITFDADWFTASDAAWMDVGTNDWSVTWCHKINGTPGARMQILGHDGQGTGGEWAVGFEASIASRLLVRTSTSYNLEFGTSVFADAWVHNVVTVDRSALATWYVNGSSVATVDVSANAATDLTNASSIWLGSRSATPGYPVVGSLDEVAFWNGTLLTSGQAAALYAAR